MINKVIDSMIYLLIWVFTFKLTGILFEKLELDDNGMIKLCLIGLIVTMYLYYSNTIYSSDFK